jgi:hypothetical protein
MSWIMRLQQRLSDRLHAGDDAVARQAGWTITKTRGRFGFAGRVYHDPRFGQRQAEASKTAQPTGVPRGTPPRPGQPPHHGRRRQPSQAGCGREAG